MPREHGEARRNKLGHPHPWGVLRGRDSDPAAALSGSQPKARLCLGIFTSGQDGEAGSRPQEYNIFGSRMVRTTTHLLLMALLLITSPPMAASQGLTEHVKILLSTAQDAAARGDFQTAAAKYREVLKVHPHLPEVEANLGLMLHLVADYNGAIETFQQVLRDNPELFVANLFLGLDLLQVQQPKKALVYLQKAQSLNPKDDQVLMGLANAYAVLQDLDKANEVYLRLANAQPRNAHAWYGAGVTFLGMQRAAAQRLSKVDISSLYAQALFADSERERGMLSDAARAYKGLIRTEPPPPIFLHAALGFVLLGQGDLQSALSEFQAELQSRPSCLLAHLGLAALGFRGESGVDGWSEIAQIWKTDRDFVTVNAGLLWTGVKGTDLIRLQTDLSYPARDQADPDLCKALLMSLQRAQEGKTLEIDWSLATSQPGLGFKAERGGSSQVSVDPTQLFNEGRYSVCADRFEGSSTGLSPRKMHLLQECAYYSGRYQIVLALSRLLLEANQDDSAALYWRVRATQIMGLAAVFRASTLDSNSPILHVLLGDAYREGQNREEAEAEYRKALEADPENFRARLGLAKNYYEAFDWDHALPELQKVLALRPRDPDASHMMGDILSYRHQFNEALPFLKAALAAAPETLPGVHALLAQVYTAQGNLEEAISECQQSLPGDHDGSYHVQLAQLYRKRGDLNAAAKALEAAQRLRANKMEKETSVLGSVH